MGRGRGKRTIAREDAAKALVALATVDDREEQAEAAKELIGEVLKQNRRLAKHVLHDFMVLFQERAMGSLAQNEGGTGTVTKMEDFKEWAKLACTCAEKLAPYQSPTFKAVSISAPPPIPPAGDNPNNVTQMPLDSNSLARMYQRMIRGDESEREAG